MSGLFKRFYDALHSNTANFWQTQHISAYLFQIAPSRQSNYRNAIYSVD